ncbi:MAG: TonB-dependent receptor, partial [Rikenellaceae bacterium]|nr:TonB-dependent receptor [Rikenellaceae bacterium]
LTIVGNKSRVHAVGIDVPLKDLPITVTRLNSEVMQRKSILTLEDAVRFLPGVTVSDQLGAFQRYSVRGVSDAVIAIDGFRDERSLINHVPYSDLSAVESIEVLKGPTTVLSGHSVMGGILNIVRRKATGEFSANARLGYGSWGQKQSTMGFGRKIAGPVNYYANFHYSTMEGYRKVGADRISGMLNLESKIGREGYLNATLNISDDKYSTEIGSAPLMTRDTYTRDGQLFAREGERNPLADYHTTYNDWANNHNMHRKAWDAGFIYTHKLTEGINLRNRFNYSASDLDYAAVESMSYAFSTSEDSDYKWYYDYENSDHTITRRYVQLDSLKSGDPLTFNPETYNITNTLELTGQFQTGSITHRYTGGWTYSYFDYTQYNGYQSDDVWGPGKNQKVSVVNPQLVRDWWDSKVSVVWIRKWITNGIYFVDVMDINDKWKGMISGRFDTYHHRDASAPTVDGKQKYRKEDRPEWKKVKASAFTYRVGLVFNPSDVVSLYGSAASYFKPLNTFYNPNSIYLDKNGHEFTAEEGGKVFDPEKGSQAEVGIRLSPDPKLEFNASIFYINKYNTVKTLGTVDVEENEAVTTKSIVGQVGRSDSQGFDMEVTYRPLHSLQIVGGLGWSDYRIRKINKSDKFPEFTESNTNQRATGAPRTTAFVYADYTITQGIFKHLSFHVSGTYQDRIYRSITDHTYYPALFLVDAGVYYTIKSHVTVSALVNNVFDKEYFVKTTTMGKPINYMFTLSYKFR